MPQPRPLVSVILAARNEIAHVRPCVASLLAQKTPDFDLEILAADGLSNDGTREFLEQVVLQDARVRVLSNEGQRSPCAFNLGLREAKGEFVCIFGAHTVYKKDYIAVCLKELLARGAAGCGGRVVTEAAAETLQAHLVASVLAHPFGSSRKSFRTHAEGYAENANYVVIRKQALMDVGGYDEELARNEDNDTNQKLLAMGHRLYCTWKTQCIYHPKETVGDLFRYAFRNGFWNVISLRRNADSMGALYFVPFLFVVGLLSAFLAAAAGFFLTQPLRALSWVPLALLLFAHLAAGAVASVQVFRRERYLGSLWLPPVFFGFHFAYGLGTLFAFAKGARASTPFSVRWKSNAQTQAAGKQAGISTL